MDSFIPLNQEVLRGTVQLSEPHHQRERAPSVRAVINHQNTTKHTYGVLSELCREPQIEGGSKEKCPGRDLSSEKLHS